jgi:hypothetical protein
MSMILTISTFVAVVLAVPAAAQTPGAQVQPSLPPGAEGAQFPSGNTLVASSATPQTSFLWIVDAGRHTVTVCEKHEGGTRDFSCIRKPLP